MSNQMRTGYFTTKVLILVLIAITIDKSSAKSNPCCQDVNVVHDRRCLHGGNITGITCPQRYLKKLSELVNISWSFDSQDNLIYGDSVIAPDSYCESKLHTSQEEFLLICFDEAQANWNDATYIFYGSIEFISVGFIILTILIYTRLPELLDLQGICIIHSITGLALTFLVLGILKILPYFFDGEICLLTAYTVYFAGLYSFFWLNTLSFHIWRTVVNPSVLSSVKHWKLIYYIFGIGGPSLLSVLLVLAHALLDENNTSIHPGFGEGKCWFRSTQTQFIYFYGPICLLITFNIIYYVWTISTLCKEIAKCDETKYKILKYKLLLCIKLFFIMGLSWIFEVTSAALHDRSYVLDIVWHITDTLNSLQGILIFLILIVFRKRVIRLLANRTYCGLRLPGRWRNLTDDECEDNVEEYNLSEKV